CRVRTDRETIGAAEQKRAEQFSILARRQTVYIAVRLCLSFRSSPPHLCVSVVHNSLTTTRHRDNFLCSQLAVFAFFLLSNSSSMSVERLSIVRNVSAFFSNSPELGSAATSTAASNATVG